MVKKISKKDLGKMRSEKLLSDFLKYCVDNPELRFWQALRNWSGANFIYLSNMELSQIGEVPKGLKIEDTFYFEHKNDRTN